MVQRNSQGQAAQLQATPQVGDSGLGAASPQNKAGMFSTQVASPPATVAGRIHAGYGTQLVQNLLGKLGKSMSQIVDAERQQAYLDGAAALGAGVAEEELETNLFTRNWKIAGHRDMTGRMAAAEYESELIRDLKAEREMSPEDYAGLISQKRKQFMPTVQSMSTQGRLKMFDQLLTMERSAIQKHKQEHAKFIVEQHVQGISTNLNTTLDNLIANRGIAGVSEAIRDEAYVKMYNNIWMNDSLDLATKSKLINEAVGYTLQQGDFSLYHAVNSMKMPNSELSMSQNMGFEERTKLARAYESARGQYQFERGYNAYEQILGVDTSIRNGIMPDISRDEYKRMLDSSTHDGLIPVSSRDAYMQRFDKLALESANTVDLSDAYRVGNMDVLYQQGVGMDKIAKQETQRMLKAGLGTEDVAFYHLNVGIRTGNPAALKEFGDIAGMAINAYITSSDADIDPSVHKTMQSILSVVDSAPSDVPQAVVKARLLQGLDGEAQLFVASVMGKKEFGNIKDDNIALNATRHEFAQRSQMDSSTLSDIKSAQADMVREIIGKAGDSRYMTTLFSNNLDRLQFRKNFNPFDSQALEQAAWQQTVATELSIELNGIIQSGIPLDDKTLATMAAGNVLKRTLFTDHGAVIIPRNVDLNEVYSTPDGYTTAEIVTKALGSMYKPTRSDARVMMEYQGGGLSIREFDDNTMTFTEHQYYSREQVQEQVALEVKMEKEQVNRLAGNGESVKVNGGIVNVNGQNTAGVRMETAFKIRKSLARYEAVRYKRYKDGVDDDGNPRYSIGVGVNTGNPIWNRYFKDQLDDNYTIDQDTVDKLYRDATDDVLQEAVNRQVQLPAGSDQAAYLELISHQLYQRGATKLDKEETFQTLQRQLSQGDKINARKTLRQTVSYKAAHAERKRYYEFLLSQI